MLVCLSFFVGVKTCKTCGVAAFFRGGGAVFVAIKFTISQKNALHAYLFARGGQ